MSDDSEATGGPDVPARTLDGQRVSEAHRELFHYTSIGALQGMLENRTLWATRATHLNDSTEMLRLWPLLEQALAEPYAAEIELRVANDPGKLAELKSMGGARPIAGQDVRMYITTLRGLLLGDGAFGGIAPPFVTSFATHSTDTAADAYRRQHGMLSQWRGYAGDDGIAVVFDPVGLERLIAQESDRHYYWPMSFADVVYDDAPDLARRLEALFKAVPDFARRLLEGHENAALPLIDPKFASTVAVAAGRLKHHAFREEAECRVVAAATPVAMAERMIAEGAKLDRPFKPVHHRRGRTASIPYIKLFDGLGERLPITRVIVGPSRHQQAVLEEVRDLVRGHGLDPEAVQGSEIPFVGSA